MAPVIRIAEGITEVTQHDLAELRRPALVEPLKSERIFLHIDDTALLQEMIIAMHRDTIVLPHRHPCKAESLHVLTGSMELIFFDDRGEEQRRIRMDADSPSLSPIVRINKPIWHSINVLSEFVVVHEVTLGPFDSNSTELAEWNYC